MSRRSWMAALSALVLWFAGPVHGAQQNERSVENQARIDRWREALDLDLAAVVVSEGPPLVSGRGALSGDAEARALVARALGSVGRGSTAFALLDDARPSTPIEKAHVDLARASLLLEGDRLNELIALLAPRGPQSLRHADQPEAWLLVGRAWSRGGEGAKAEVFLRGFLERSPWHPAAPSAWHMLAQHAIARRDAAAAGELRRRAQAASRWQSYHRARRLQKREDPEAPLPRLGLAQLWMEAEQWEPARRELLELTALAPDFDRGWAHLAEVERRRTQLEAALGAYDRALSLNPDNDYARFGRARLAYDQERWDDALADLKVLNQTELPEDASASRSARVRDAWLWRARVEAQRGEDATSRAALERYRDLGGEESLDR